MGNGLLIKIVFYCGLILIGYYVGIEDMFDRHHKSLVGEDGLSPTCINVPYPAEICLEAGRVFVDHDGNAVPDIGWCYRSINRRGKTDDNSRNETSI